MRIVKVQKVSCSGKDRFIQRDQMVEALVIVYENGTTKVLCPHIDAGGCCNIAPITAQIYKGCLYKT